MKTNKAKISLIFLLTAAMSLGACATMNNIKQSVQSKPIEQSQELISRLEPISLAISQWANEEAQISESKSIFLKPNSEFANLDLMISTKLKADGYEIASANSNDQFRLSYQIYQSNDQILLKINTNLHEAARLFSLSDNNTITPSSPLTVRLVQ